MPIPPSCLGELFTDLPPEFGLALTRIFLNQRPHGYHAAGIALILTGIGIMSRPGRGRVQVPAESE